MPPWTCSPERRPDGEPPQAQQPGALTLPRDRLRQSLNSRSGPRRTRHGSSAPAIQAECDRRGWTLERIAEDVLSGKSKGSGHAERIRNRPGLAAALDDLDHGRAEVLLVSRLDRLSRSLPVSGEVLERAEERGWAVQALDIAMDMTTPAGELLAGMLIVMARYERRAIHERIVAALAHAKEHGTKSGRPIGRVSGLSTATVKLIQRHRRAGKTMQAIADALNDAGVPTSQGGRWCPAPSRWYSASTP